MAPYTAPQAVQNSKSPKKLLVAAPVHRLGRGTSGLLLCAYSAEARRALSEMLAKHSANEEVFPSSMRVTDGASSKERLVTKIYRGRAQGLVQEDEQMITTR